MRHLPLLAAACALLVASTSLPFSRHLRAAQSHADVVWDTYGVAHIFAPDLPSMFEAHGRAQMEAQGNLLLHLYGESRGRGAEYWGPSALALDAFRERAAQFFRESGWGEVSVAALEGVVAAIDAADWAEAEPGAALPYPGCFYSAGLLADFFGRVADAPLAALEVECRSSGSDRCRFLVGSESVLTALHEQMAAGVDCTAALAEIAAATGRR